MPDSRLSVRRMTRLTVLMSAVCFAISSLVLSPIYIRFASDVVYADTWWVYLLYYFTEEGLVDLAVFAVCYPAAIYAVWQAGLKRAIRVPVAFSLITLVKFILNFFMTSIVDGALPDISAFLSVDLPLIGAMYLLEILQYVLVILCTLAVKRRYMQKQMAIAENAQHRHSEATRFHDELFPFTKLLSAKNPIQLSALWMTVMVLGARILMHQIYQYTLYIHTGSTDGLLVMALDLISDVFVAALLYFAALLLLSRFHRRDTESAVASQA